MPETLLRFKAQQLTRPGERSRVSLPTSRSTALTQPVVAPKRGGLFQLLRIAAAESLRRKRPTRVPEPMLVMADATQVDAYAAEGYDGGVMAPTHLFHTANACDVLRSGDRVLDLGCGPGTQLGQVAQLHPECQFIGIDLSEAMLRRAAEHLQSLGVSNVELRHGDITNLREYPDASIAAVISSMTLHHLPDLEHLGRLFEEVARVLKPGGGVYLADFARLKSQRSMRYFAHQYADRQHESFTNDYWHSLRAAFSPAEFRRAMTPLRGRARHHAMFPIGLMQAIKSPPRADLNPDLRSALREAADDLPPNARSDLRGMAALFRVGGMRSGLLDG